MVGKKFIHLLKVVFSCFNEDNDAIDTVGNRYNFANCVCLDKG